MRGFFEYNAKFGKVVQYKDVMFLPPHGTLRAKYEQVIEPSPSAVTDLELVSPSTSPDNNLLIDFGLLRMISCIHTIAKSMLCHYGMNENFVKNINPRRNLPNSSLKRIIHSSETEAAIKVLLVKQYVVRLHDFSAFLLILLFILWISRRYRRTVDPLR